MCSSSLGLEGYPRSDESWDGKRSDRWHNPRKAGSEICCTGKLGEKDRIKKQLLTLISAPVKRAMAGSEYHYCCV